MQFLKSFCQIFLHSQAGRTQISQRVRAKALQAPPKVEAPPAKRAKPTATELAAAIKAQKPKADSAKKETGTLGEILAIAFVVPCVYEAWTM